MPPQINNLTDILPKHPHRTAHILLSLLAIIVVVGCIYFYKTSHTQPPPQDKVVKDYTEENLAAISRGAPKNISPQATLNILKQIDSANKNKISKNKK